MSDFILEYECLESIVHYSKALGKRAEEYSEGLESKIIRGIGNVTGGIFRISNPGSRFCEG